MREPGRRRILLGSVERLLARRLDRPVVRRRLLRRWRLIWFAVGQP